MEKYLLIPLEDTVVFPNMTVTLPLDTGDDEARAARAAPRGRLREGGHGRRGRRAAASPAAPGRDPDRPAPRVARRGRDREPADATSRSRNGRTRPRHRCRRASSRREYRAVVEEILELRDADPRIGDFLRSVAEPGALADTCAYSPDLTFEQRVELLETIDVVERLELAVALQRDRLAELQVRRRIREDVESGAQKQQREYFLRKQMDSIRKELGEDEASVVDEYRTKIDEAGMPDEVREQAERELGRLERMGEASGEASMIRTYLDWLLAVPWGKRSEERLDPKLAREILDADHAGLDDVKERIVEYLAVRSSARSAASPRTSARARS